VGYCKGLQSISGALLIVHESGKSEVMRRSRNQDLREIPGIDLKAPRPIHPLPESLSHPPTFPL